MQTLVLKNARGFKSSFSANTINYLRPSLVTTRGFLISVYASCKHFSEGVPDLIVRQVRVPASQAGESMAQADLCNLEG